MHGTWKKALAPALAVAVSALSLSATALPANAAGTKPTYVIAYEGPLSGGNAQLGLNMEYSVELAINNANATGALPFALKFKPADDQGSATASPTVAQELVSNSQVMAVVGRLLRSHGGGRAHLLGRQPGHSQPLRHAPAPGPKGMAQLLQGRRRRQRPGPADAQFVSHVLKAKSVYSVDDGSAYAQSASKCLRHSGQVARYQADAPDRSGHQPMRQRWHR